MEPSAPVDLSSFAPVNVMHNSGETPPSLDDEMPVLSREGNLPGLINVPLTVTPVHSLQIEGNVQSSSENRPAIDTQKGNIQDIENKKRYSRNYCDRKYSSPAARYNHYNRDHSVEYKLDRENSSSQAVSSYGPEYPCKFCPNSYWNHSTYINHVTFRHPEGSRNVLQAKEKANSNDVNEKAAKSIIFKGTLNAETESPPLILQEDSAGPPMENTTERSAETDSSLHVVQTVNACEYCTARFATEELLLLHEVEKHQEDDLSDDEVSKSGEDPSYPRSVHNIKKSVSPKVKIAVHTPSSVKNVLKHSFKCKFCPRTFKAAHGLGIHVSKIHSDLKDSTAEIYICSHCPKKYDKYTTLYNHYAAHHDNKPRPYMEQFHASDSNGPANTTVATVDAPQKSGDTNFVQKLLKKESSHGSQQLKCDQCTKVFINADYLAKHKLKHAPPPSPGPIFCENCGQVFKGIQYLTQHKKGSKCGRIASSNNTGSTVAKKENTDMDEQMPINVQRKRYHEESSNVTEDMADFENDEYHLPPKILKGLFNTKEEYHQSVSSPKQTAKESPLPLVKVEKEESYENSSSTSSTVSCQAPENSSSPSNMAPGISRDLLNQCNNKEQEPKELKPATVSSDIDCMITQPYTPITTRQALQQIPSFHAVPSNFTSTGKRQSIDSQPPNILPNLITPISTRNIEKSHLPLSAAVITRAVQHPGELMVIWSSTLEDDLISAGHINSAKCILCVQDLDMFRVTDQQKQSLKKCEIITFTMLASNDTTSLWTVISFDNQNSPNGLRNKLFRNFQDVENVFVVHSKLNGKIINNMMRYSKDGLFPILSQTFTKKTMAFNCEE